MNLIDFALRGDHITLEALLKAAGIAGGGAAKALIGEGAVSVNDEVDARRGRKVRAGDHVIAGETRIEVRAEVAEGSRDLSEMPGVPGTREAPTPS